jgi:small subunit ribosomal protein S20
MANHKSAKKRIRRNEAFNTVNSNRRNRIRTYVKRVEAAIDGGNADEARNALKLAQPELHRGVSRGVIHKKTVARKLSRLSARIKALAA